MKNIPGFTLVELMVTLAVLAIIVTTAVPGMNNFLSSNRLRGATSQFYSDVQFARSESIKRKTDISVSITSNGQTNWCYGISRTPGCDCTVTDLTDTNACALDFSGENILKVGHSPDFTGVMLITPGGANQTVATFNPTRGIATSSSSVVFQSANELETHINISVLGKVSACSPSGIKNVMGYSPC